MDRRNCLENVGEREREREIRRAALFSKFRLRRRVGCTFDVPTLRQLDISGLLLANRGLEEVISNERDSIFTLQFWDFVV